MIILDPCPNTIAPQAMNIPFNVMSASDPNYKCCRMLSSSNNRTKVPTHWHRDLEAQIAGKACLRHPFASGCDPSPVHVDVGICGTPCHPFSTQRAGRFEPGSVEAHHECDIALGQFIRWLARFQPSVQIFEQVMGFTMPFTKGGSYTPLQRSFV